MPNARQFATLIWLAIVATGALSQPSIRSSVKGLGRAAEDLKIIIPLLALMAWVAALTFGGSLVNLWTVALTTDTMFWFVGSALVLLFNLERVTKKEGFFRRTALGTLGATALAEFFVNELFVFSLPVELVILPVLSFLVMISVFAENKPEYRPAKRLVDAVIGAVGIGLATYIIYRVVTEWDVIEKAHTLRTFALPIWLMLGVLPFLYFVSLYSNYELAFTWIDFRADAEGSRWRAKLALLLRLHGRTRHVGAFTMYWGKEMGSTSSFREAWRVAGKFLAWAQEKEDTKGEKNDRLTRYAGVNGVDEEGLRLDQREFDETKKALQALAGAQMGWYRNRGGRYRQGLLEILESRFERAGLPKQHGITLHVAEDGQSWWAWRRTISGWCFAIGAADPPPDEWLFDGPEPPRAFPGEEEEPGWSQWGADSLNW